MFQSTKRGRKSDMGAGTLAGLRIRLLLVFVLALGCFQSVVWGAADGGEDVPSAVELSDPVPHRSDWWKSMKYEACLVRYETAALLAGITAVGLYSWDWGSTSDFHTNSEGWFGPDTGSGGADKLGHAFTAYAFTNILTEAIRAHREPSPYAPLTSAVLSMGLMTYVEFFDGFSNDHGFSYEDMVVDALGVGFAYLRHRIPGLREKLDFRLEYWPSGHKGFRPLSDYSGQRYIMALKLSGFETLRKTPLRYVELHAGYFTRGFLRDERLAGEDRERTPFLGIGVNLNELFFGWRAHESRTCLDRARRLFFEHIQIPYTSYRFYEDTKTTR